MKRFFLPFGVSAYMGCYQQACLEIQNLFPSMRFAVVADESLVEPYARDLCERLQVDCFPLPKGEEAKSFSCVEALVKQLRFHKFGKDTCLIALGGGSVSDLVGFVASIYMRGVACFLIPSTLLAMVDASIGGKTAINVQGIKNLVGTFYSPRAVVIDTSFLQTLPEKEKLNGIVEVRKLGLVYDRTLLEGLDIEKAILAKAAIVEQDAKDQGMRRLLNFGHTVGHGLEGLSEYEISHGEAVAMGCMVEAHVSFSFGYLRKKDFEKILLVFEDMPLKLPRQYERKALLDALSVDKKSQQGRIGMVCLDSVGSAKPFEGRYVCLLEEKDLSSSLAWMEKRYG